MGGAEQTADRHCGVMNGTPLPLPLGEVAERSEDGEGRRLNEAARPSQSPAATALPEMRINSRNRKKDDKRRKKRDSKV